MAHKTTLIKQQCAKF